MTKAEFVELLARDHRLGKKKDAADALDAVLDALTQVMASGDNVSFTGFGKFSVADRSARKGVNPRTGEKIDIAASKVPRFSAGAGLKNRVKGV